MKASVWTNYGPPEVLQLREVETPTPKNNEVLIKVHATTVTAGDCEARRFSFPLMFWLPLRLYMGVRKPRIPILGQEVAGEIEAVGSEVTRFKPGDQVFAATLMRFGAYAEYICIPETYPMATKPSSLSFEEATTLPTGGINGLYFLRKGNVRAGEEVLINGAGGSIGTYALQVAKLSGAKVTCVDRASKLDMLRALGADHVIDYTKEDFTSNGKRYDVIIDIVGTSPFSGSLRALKPQGRYILGNPRLSGILRGLWSSRRSDKKVIPAIANYAIEEILYLKELATAGKLKPVIDRRYPLEQTAEAHRYVETGDKQGNVVITVIKNTDA